MNQFMPTPHSPKRNFRWNTYSSKLRVKHLPTLWVNSTERPTPAETLVDVNLHIKRQTISDGFSCLYVAVNSYYNVLYIIYI